MLVLAITTVSCGHYQYPRELLVADSLTEVRPDSAVSLLRDSDKWSDASEPVRMYYRLLCIKAKDKASNIDKGDSIVLSILDHYRDGGDPALLPDAYYYAGRYYAEMHDAPQALDYFHKAMELLQNSERTKLKGVVASQMGYLYDYQGLNDYALKMYKLSCKVAEQTRDDIGMMYGLLDIGTTYGFRNDADSALLFCLKALEIAKKTKDEEKVTMMLSQVARYYNMSHQYHKALPYIQQALRGKAHKSDYRSILSIAVTTYSHTQQEDSAIVFCNKLLGLNDMYGNLFAHKELIDYYVKKHEPEKALAEIGLYVAYDDSVKQITNTDALARAKALYDYQLRERENIKLKSEKTRMSYILTICLIGIILSMLSLFLYYLFVRQRNKAFQYKLQRYKDYLAQYKNQETEAKEKIYETDIFHLAEERAMKGQCLTEKEWYAMKEAFLQSFPHFTDGLSDLFKTSEQELRVCMLVRLGFQVKDISNLTAHTPSSVSKTRKRMAYRAFGEHGTIEDIDQIIKTL